MSAPGGPGGQGEWIRPPATREERRFDVVLALILLMLSGLSMALLRAAGATGRGDPADPWVSVLCLAAVLLPLALRRRYPVAVAVITTAGFILAVEIEVQEVVILNIGFFVALYTLGAWSRRHRAASIVRWSVLAAMGVWLIAGFARTELGDSAGGSAGAFESLIAGSAELALVLYTVLINVLYFAGAIWFGHRAWASARDRALIAEQAERLRAEQRTVAAQAVVLERLRIARELHDAVAHHVSVMGVQAAAARTTLHSAPETAERSIRHVEDSARRSVVELHQLLGALRQEDAVEGSAVDAPWSGAERASADVDEPSAELDVHRIPDLIEEARGLGMKVQWQVVGEPRPLGPLLQLNLYRIVQEALTNVRKHAGPEAHADVRLRYGATAVEAEITDDGAGRRTSPPQEAASPGTGTGHGLLGMRERAGASGGTLLARPRAQSGFIVRAEIPYAPEGVPQS